MKQSNISIAVCGGNLLEWYDYSLYGQLAPLIAILFFPTQNHFTALLLTYAVYALSFFIRPFSSLLMGRIGDQYGRKKVLIISSITMTACTFVMGFLPSYQQVGVLAPLLLLALRLLQGVAISVEFTGATTYQIERTQNRKNVLGALVQSTTFIGTFFASAIVFVITLTLPHHAVISWGWRIPFFVAGLIGLWLIKARLSLPETAGFLDKKQELKTENSQQKLDWTTLILSFFIPAAATAGVYFFVYEISFVTTALHIDASYASLYFSAATLIIIFFVPFAAKIADRIGIRQMLFSGLILLAITAVPIFWMMAQSSLTLILMGQLLFAVVLSPYLGLNGVFMAGLYKIHSRVRSFSFIYNLSVAIFGSTIPLLATYLQEKTHSNNALSVYFIVMCLASLTALFFLCRRNAVQPALQEKPV